VCVHEHFETNYLTLYRDMLHGNALVHHIGPLQYVQRHLNY
jgi:hypothetical protein